ncbi:MAG: hypothetical protein ACOZQL_33265 [Myxococcota bacterium]
MLALLLMMTVAAAPPKALGAKFGCTARAPCEVVSEQKAGADDEGVKLRVLQVTRGAQQADDGARECTVEEYWAVRLAKPQEARVLLSLCNDGYGAAGVGEDTVSVKANRLIHEQFGGSSWRWVSQREFQLWPPRPVSASSTSFHASAPQLTDETRWSWRDFTGERVRQLSVCGEDGQPDLREEAPARPVRSALIPRVALPAEYVSGGWKTTALGSCSASAGFVVFGAKGEAADASLRVVAAEQGTVLFLEVSDDAWVTNEKKWIAGDHLELWLSGEAPSTTQDCLGKRGAQASQWAIDLPSGAVRAGHGGRVALPAAEVVGDGKVARVKLTLPSGDWPALTVVYSDSDDGAKQERLLATSQFVFPQAATLGQLHPLAPRVAACAVKDGALTAVSTWQVPETGPAFPSSGD